MSMKPAPTLHSKADVTIDYVSGSPFLQNEHPRQVKLITIVVPFSDIGDKNPHIESYLRGCVSYLWDEHPDIVVDPFIFMGAFDNVHIWCTVATHDKKPRKGDRALH